MNSVPQNPIHLTFLDGLRGLAAFYVMVGHCRWLLWESYQQYLLHSSNYTGWETVIVYALIPFRYGHQAVLFFFILSGFVIHLRYARQLSLDAAGSRFDWWPYLLRRFRRIYPPLVGALLLTALLDSLGRHWGYGIYWADTPYPLINQNLYSHLDVGTLIGNLTFLMDAYVPTFGVNGPLWSLKYEWWFYMIYPGLWWLSRRSVGLATGAVLLLFGVSFIPGWWPEILLDQVAGYLLSWWLGGLLAEVYMGRIRLKYVYLMPLLLLLPVGFSGMDGSVVLKDTLSALGFMGLLATLFTLQSRGFSLRLLSILKPLGDCSYTLYVTHFPILVLGSGYLIHHHGSLPQHFGYVALGIFVSVSMAWGLHFVLERPFTRQRQKTRLT